jgi:hypothetical protein
MTQALEEEIICAWVFMKPEVPSLLLCLLYTFGVGTRIRKTTTPKEKT